VTSTAEARVVETQSPTTVVKTQSQTALVKFPMEFHDRASSYCIAYFEELLRAAKSVDPIEVERAAGVLLDAYQNDALVFACGNGGSAAVANHLQCDHLKGVRTGTDLTPRVVSLTSNVELLTAVGNDIGYDEVFSYQMQAQGRPGDVLIAISSSGRSENILQAIRCARRRGIRTIALTGFTGGRARMLADVAVHVDCTNYGVVEDLHQTIMHTMAQYVRQSRMTSDVIATTTF
jgi:phosphoheptose isomerase